MKNLSLLLLTILGLSTNAQAANTISLCHLAIVQAVGAAQTAMVADEDYRRSIDAERAYPELIERKKNAVAHYEDQASQLKKMALEVCVDKN